MGAKGAVNDQVLLEGARNMPKITIGFGVVLCAIGLFGYFRATTENPSLTALIPFFVGDVLILCGVLGFVPNLRKHAMHAAAAVGLLGFIAAAGRLVMSGKDRGEIIGSLISDEPSTHRAPRLLLLMALVCLIFVIVCVVSFISARRGRSQSGGPSA
jgi:MFS family permease